MFRKIVEDVTMETEIIAAIFLWFLKHFPVTFEIIGKCLIIFVKLTLGKNGVTGPRREIDIRYEFDFEKNLKDLGCK